MDYICALLFLQNPKIMEIILSFVTNLKTGQSSWRSSLRVVILQRIWGGRKKVWVNTRFHTGSVGNSGFHKISLQSQVKFSGFCDISERVSGFLWTWDWKQNPAAANLNTARQRLWKKCLHELLGNEHTEFHLLTFRKPEVSTPHLSTFV